MCGIAGAVVRAGAGEGTLLALARRMGEAIAHRGPDGSGEWADPATGTALAHRRLAIIDLSPAGAQPMTSACGRWTVTFNGEIYNFAALRRRLEADGRAPPWRGRSDTEVLVAAVAAWGLAATLGAVDGMFALAAFDRDRRTLALARDRFGEKPLLYGFAGPGFVFASELGAIRAVAPFGDADIDLRAVRALLDTGAIPAPLSILRPIRKLPPGTVLELGPDDVAAAVLPPPRPYWSARAAAAAAAAAPFAGSLEDALDALEATLAAAVGSRLMADVPLGTTLSGGIDSGLVAAFAAAASATPVRTFTVGFEDAGFDESADAARLAARIGARHTTLRLSAAEALALAPTVGTRFDEPFGDSSQIPTVLVSAALRREVTVALSGDGGDELFGGYVRHRAGPRIAAALARVPQPLRAGAARVRDAVGGPRLGRALARARGARGEAGLRVAKALDLLDADGPPAVYARLCGLWPAGAGPLDDAAEAAAAALPGAGLDLSRRFMLADTEGYMADDILVKVDRAAMAVSLEVRPPFLSPDVFALAWSLPTPWLVGADAGGRAAGKRILRRLAARRLPELDWTRPKRGFAVPLDAWLRGPLRPWAEALLSGLGRDGAIPYRTATIGAAWRDHLAGRADNAARLWPVLALAAWRARG